MGTIFFGAIAGYVIVVALMYSFQRSLLYHPSASIMEPAHYGETRMKRVEIVTEDGLPLASWYRAASPGQPTLLLFHGNAGHIGHRQSKVQAYLDAGYGVFLLSYRGFGANPGYPTEAGLYMDARAAMAYLEAQKVPYFRLVLYGESLGTGVAVEMAQGRGIAALILESPFTSINDVAQHHYFYLPAKYLIKDRFDSARKIQNVKIPTLFIHGEQDRTIPVEFGRQLFMMANNPKHMILIPEAGHNNLDSFGIEQKIINFIDSVLPESGSQRQINE